MENKVEFILIGCGRIAQRHAEHISRFGKLIAVCDVDQEKSRIMGEKYGVAYYTSIDDLIKSKPKADVVSICTPNGLHAQHSITFLKHGYHVLCEKPMAITAHDCGEMIKVAEKYNRRLFVIKQNRFNPPVVAVKKLIEEGKLGEIYSIQLNCFWNRDDAYYENSWKGTLNMDGGTLFTQFSHFIDLLYWMFGDVKNVSAKINNYAHRHCIEFEDTGVVLLEFTNGVIGTINYTVNSTKKNMEGSITVFAEKGTIKVGGQYLNELEYQQIIGEEIANLPEGNKANNYGTYMGSMSNHDKIYKNVIDVLQNGASITTNAFEGLKTIEIIEKIYNAARSKAN